MNRQAQFVRQVPDALPKLLAVVLGIVCPFVAAEPGRSIYVPISFHSGSGVIPTTVCLQVTELVGGQVTEGSNGTVAAEAALKSVIAAIKRKDRDALLRLADSKQGRDPKRFDEQATAYFRQFEMIELLGVSRAYELDGLVVLFASLRFKENSFFAPFVFTNGDSGSVGFLPYRTDLLSYQLLEDWLFAKWGPANVETPTYCSKQAIERATHRVAVVPPIGTTLHVLHPSYLFLTGVLLESPGEFNSLALQIQSFIKVLDAAVSSDRMDNFYSLLDSGDGKSARAWYLAADGAERSKFKEAIREQRAFFFFDASPLLIVYTKTSAGNVQTMYLTFDSKHDLRWANSARVTLADRVFKRGALHDASMAGKPFSGVALK